MSRTSTLLTLTPAERARTIVASASTLRVASPELTLEVHRHGVTQNGSLLFQAPDDFGADFGADLGAGPASYRITATAIDVATVPQPDRLRGTVTLAGPLYDVVDALPAGMRMHLTGSDEPDGRTRLVRLSPDSVTLAWRCESPVNEPAARQIPLEDFRGAFPDPLLGYEAGWLPHLQADHASLLIGLARHELGWNTEPGDVRALGIDRFGLVLRVTDEALGGRGQRDLRIGFDRTVICGCDVREAFSALVNRAMPGAGPIC